MKSIKLIPIVALLALGGSICLPTQANAQTTSNRQQPAANQPNLAQLSLTLDRQPNENYDTLVGRAEAAARSIAVRTFNQNPGVRAVNITVLGQNEGSIAPLISLEVNRQNWASRPNTQLWATYFKASRNLLRLDAPTGNVANQPANGNPGQTNVNGNAGVNNNGLATNGNPVLNNNAGNAVFDTAPNNAAGTSTNLNQNGQGLTGNPLNNAGTGFNNNPGFNNNNPNNTGTGFGTNPGFNNNNLNNTGTGSGTNPGFNNNNLNNNFGTTGTQNQ